MGPAAWSGTAPVPYPTHHRSLLQIARVKPFGEPAVHGSEQFAALLWLALVAPEPCHAHCGAELPGLGCLPRRWSSQCALEHMKRLPFLLSFGTNEKTSKNSFLLKL